MHNELNITQNRDFSRVQAINAKTLAKYNLNLIDLEKKAYDDEEEAIAQKVRPKAPSSRKRPRNGRIEADVSKRC